MPLLRTSDLQFRKGTESFTLLSLNKTITFATPFPPEIGTSYSIYWQQPNALSVSVSITNKTAAGFTVALGVSLSMELKWYAVEDRA